MPRPKKWCDAETIPSKLELALSLVPQSDCELSAESLPHPFVMIFVKMRNDLSVAVCKKAVPACDELFAPLDVVE